MKFNTTKDILLKGIQNVQSAIGAKTNLPILMNILVEGEDTGVVMTATDLDIGIITTIPVTPSVKGSITVPAKKFSDIIRELPDKEAISFSVKKNNLVNIECEKNIFKIMGLPKEEFPQVPAFKNKDTIIVAQKKLKKMLSLTSFAISRDETRYVLNGVLLIVKPTFLRIVATDGRRLAVIEEKMQLPKTLERKVIIPTKAINELLRTLTDEGDASVSFTDNQAFFDVGAIRIVSRLIEGEFPNYEQVIPKEIKEKIVVSRDRFLAAIKRVALFTSADSLAIKMEVTADRMVLTKDTPYLGEARVELEVAYKGKDLTVGFNPEYLIDLLKSIDEETVSFEVVDSEKPGVVRVGTEYTYVVLPMQIT